jgi:hypothetical protein
MGSNVVAMDGTNKSGSKKSEFDHASTSSRRGGSTLGDECTYEGSGNETTAMGRVHSFQNNT